MSRSEQGPFMRFASAVGDLGSPFYQEERQRDVWNEASAVGFQTMLWLGLVAANVMVWVGRSAAVPYAVGTMIVVGVGSGMTPGYARRLGVNPEDSGRLTRPAVFLAVLLGLGFVAGILATQWDVARPTGGFGGGFAVGAAVGGGVAVAMLLVALGRRRRGTASPE